MPAPEADYVDSYYARDRGCNTGLRNTRRGRLDQSLAADVAIIGGGLAGLATALGLAQRRVRVVLLEARRIGWGASGRNGGFVSAGFEFGSAALVAKVGRDHARSLYRLTQDALLLVRQRVENLSPVCVPIVRGLVACSVFHDRGELERQVAALEELFGEHREVWPQEKVRSIWRSRCYRDALFNPSGFTMNPLGFALSMADMAEAAGAQLFENTPVRRVDFSRDPIRLATPAGSVQADQLVICCSGYIDGLVKPLSRATLPLTSSVVLTEPLGERLSQIIGAPYGVSDLRRVMDYYRPLPDGRLLWGGEVGSRANAGQLAEVMMRRVRRIYPQLASLKPEIAWSGVMGYATHGMPQIGRLRSGVWYDQGHGGHGMVTTTLGGELVASAIAEHDERWRLFEPFGLDPTYAPLGPWIARTLVCGYRGLDAWNIWQAKRRHPKINGSSEKISVGSTVS